jgi:hypothetical protein
MVAQFVPKSTPKPNLKKERAAARRARLIGRVGGDIPANLLHNDTSKLSSLIEDYISYNVTPYDLYFIACIISV